ncbi:MAG: acyl-CoA dehydrogenase family protein [Alphaproteobacteria bacterium]|jgi:acyl-CoA dehydrogenase|nr:acyl-CoA dehydrogenase [Rhodospirillaceae bacterium]MDG2483339.1 acyl-CoA dehydrogenase family protein [Alphaproteobacteria bacterium]MBT6206368.1 acyl-CoA dehydrogenase [Rhodospirillaceae bacterium]MBT6508976.1 acyl-CoA dehydrogenase [Rhodospirillaceae bacterium]MBT7612560.1 acyl-CoA dehydrogenase [Rhodospirillaceae bacterium]
MTIRFEPSPESETAAKLRAEVRAFLREEIAAGSFDPSRVEPQAKFDRAFSARVGARGWIGMTWPREMGGHGRSFAERYVVTEEMLAANAPIRAHFVADRQSGPVLIKYARPEVRDQLLPRIVAGELSFCIGMSEPDSGSDLFAARAKATRTNAGWSLSGTKLWTTLAHKADWMIGIFRTSPSTEDNRRHGLTQFLIDMTSPGITVRPVLFPSGEHDFNEIVFDDVFVPDEHVLGELGDAWKQATSELAFERSGAERFLETFGLLAPLVDLIGPAPQLREAESLGRMVARLHTYRHMAMAVSGTMDRGGEPVAEASVVKAGGTQWEQAMVIEARRISRLIDDDGPARDRFEDALQRITAFAPKVTIQGGTIEVLNGIVARALGLR